MLEILVLIKVTQHLANSCRMKNRSTGWSALFPIMWVGGEIVGLGYEISHNKLFDANGEIDFGSYGIGLLFAVIGGVIGFIIVKSLREIPRDNGLPQARVV
jgi:hypothetical protein